MSEEKHLIRDTANSIIEALGEKNRQAHSKIHLLTKLCGVEFVQQLLKETQEIEAGEGLMTNDGKRRRTVGGVFFYLAKGRVSDEIRKEVWLKKWKKKKETEASQ